MLKVDAIVDSIEKLDKYIDYVNKMSNMKIDKDFQKYIQDKCLKVIENTINQRMIYSGGTVDRYKANNKIREFDDGFIIYNDTSVDATTEGYNGSFSIALAFEYGTGLVGQENPKQNAWQYNVNNHGDNGWLYYKNESFHYTRGLQGMEIYRFSKEEIEAQLPKWVKDYYRTRRV